MQLHNIQRHHENKKARQIGRGGKRGKTAGRGTKGQKARAGGKIRPNMRDIIKKIPKRRGYRFKSYQVKPVTISLLVLEKAFSGNDSITPTTLASKGIISTSKGRYPKIKILSQGEVSKKFKVSGCILSAAAAEKITKAGGSVAV